MYLLARSQGLGRPAGFLGGVLLANAPGHSERFGHLYLAQYWVVPVGTVAGARGGARAGAAVAWRRAAGCAGGGARTVTAVGAVLVVGFSGVYYVAFTLVLLAVATLARRVVGTPADLLRGLAVMAGTTACIALPLAAARVGTRGELVTGQLPAQRNPNESELYAGKLMDLVLPWPHHRVPALEFLTFAYGTANRATVEVSALGIVGTAGLAGLAVSGLLALLVGRRQRPDHARWSGLMLVSFLLFTVGGLGSFIALFGTPQVRTWSRMSIYLLALALLAVGSWLTRVERRRGVLVAGGGGRRADVRREPGPDQPGRRPRTMAPSRRDGGPAYLHRASLQDRLGAGARSSSSPSCRTPRPAGLVDSGDYDQLKPYLAGADLRWSYGAMRGTAAADWMLAVDASDVRSLAATCVRSASAPSRSTPRPSPRSRTPRPALQGAFGSRCREPRTAPSSPWDIREAGADGRRRPGSPRPDPRASGGLGRRLRARGPRRHRGALPRPLRRGVRGQPRGGCRGQRVDERRGRRTRAPRGRRHRRWPRARPSDDVAHSPAELAFPVRAARGRTTLVECRSPGPARRSGAVTACRRPSSATSGSPDLRTAASWPCSPRWAPAGSSRDVRRPGTRALAAAVARPRSPGRGASRGRRRAGPVLAGAGRAREPLRRRALPAGLMELGPGRRSVHPDLPGVERRTGPGLARGRLPRLLRRRARVDAAVRRGGPGPRPTARCAAPADPRRRAGHPPARPADGLAARHPRRPDALPRGPAGGGPGPRAAGALAGRRCRGPRRCSPARSSPGRGCGCTSRGCCWPRRSGRPCSRWPSWRRPGGRRARWPRSGARASASGSVSSPGRTARAPWR